MRQTGWCFYVEYDIGRDGYDLHIAHQGYDGKRFVVKPFKAVPVEPSQIYRTPALGSGGSEDLGDARDFLQGAMDAAWKMGLRPEGFADHANEIKAVRYHLEDMRALAKVPAR